MPTTLKLSDKQLRQISASVLERVKAKALVTAPTGDSINSSSKAASRSSGVAGNGKKGSTVITSEQASKIFDNAFKKVVASK
ncbi:hypothetical protein ABNP39_22635 (plasmid) [Pantoea dispersa]|uniref:Molecular chaperone GroEL n=1 Tax=Pantoea dispersa TaxID=59814 RepID=A0ABY2ZW61_9GAMM|nr:hypothetical protein [Pantoea dispersa]TQC70012.1 hypothetical protein FK492_20020 [Pantoea dispersa]